MNDHSVCKSNDGTNHNVDEFSALSSSPDDYENENYPFRNDVLKNLTLKNKIQIIFMSLTVVPIRLVFLGISLAILWPLGSIVARGQSENLKKNPISGWRKSMLPIIRFVGRCVFFCGGFQWIKIKGQLDPNVSILVLAPHTGFYDALFVLYYNFVSVVGKAGSEHVPLFGNLTKICHPIIVNREKSESRSDTVQKIIDRVSSEQKWPSLALFPTGTCTNQKSLIRFKPGAFIPGKPVQPVCLSYRLTTFDSLTWTWDSPNVYILSWLSLCQLNTPVEFNILPVYYPNQEEKNNANLYAENVRKLMSEELKIPLSNLTYEDARLLSEMIKKGFPTKSGLIKSYFIKKKFGVKYDQIEQLIPEFVKIAKKSTGECNLENFTYNLQLVVTDPVIKFFELFDQKRSGTFTFENYVHTYFEYIKPRLDRKERKLLVQDLLALFDRFNHSSHSMYNLEELNKEVKKKFNLEFSNSVEFELNDQKHITKTSLEKFFLDGDLRLYLFLISL